MSRLLAATVALLAAFAATGEIAGQPSQRSAAPPSERGPAGLEGGIRLTLNEAVAEALGSSPSAAASAAGGAAAEARLRGARAAWLPRVSVSETMLRSDNPVFVFGSLLEQGRFAPVHFDPAFLNDPARQTNFRLALNVQYTVFDQLRRMHTIRAARLGVDEASLIHEETVQRLRADVIAAYFALAVAEQRRVTAEESVLAAEADVLAMQDRLEQGLIVESDVLGAEVQLATFRQHLIEGESSLAIAQATLATLLGRGPDARVTPADDLPERLFPELSLETALARGLETRADVRTASSAERRAFLELATTRGSLLPRLDAFASWGASSDRIEGGNPDRTIGFSLFYELYDAARYARIAEKRAAAAATAANVESARDHATLEIVSAWHRSRAARSRLEVTRTAVLRAEAAARIVRERHEHGLSPTTDHLRAQAALLGVRLERIQAHYDYVVGHAGLLRAIGGLQDVHAFH